MRPKGTRLNERSPLLVRHTFAPEADLGPRLATYFDPQDESQRVLGRPVDLVTHGALTNPRFVAEADKTRRLVYAADHPQTALGTGQRLNAQAPPRRQRP